MENTASIADRILSEALALETESAKQAGALGFMARALVQATMPHRRVATNEFSRQNGDFVLTMLARSKVGLPFGSIPRLLTAWLTTEAVRTQERELILGASLSGFMHELGLGPPTGGRWGNIARLREQTRRLFCAVVSCSYEGESPRDCGGGFLIADQHDLWWDPKSPDQIPAFGSTVKLSETFFKEVTEHPVPVDMRALRKLKRSPMALDIYCWLTYRMSYLRGTTEIPWELLALQFGSDYGRLRDFSDAFLGHLRKVVACYPAARVEEGPGGLILKPSRPHIPLRINGRTSDEVRVGAPLSKPG